MPIYEYRCTACQHKLESLQKFSDAPLVVCPQCGRGALTKLVSAAGFHLKGSGWYQTDFKNSGSKPAAKPDATAPEAKSGDAKTTDATPAAKPDAAKPDAAKSDAPAAKAETSPAPPSTPSSAP
jgi:putative FmdB family regulatory protein